MLERLKHSWRLTVLGDSLNVIHVDVKDNGDKTVREFVFDVKNADVRLVEGAVDQEGLPVALLITGSGVITKTLPRNKGTEDQDIVAQLDEYRGSDLAHASNLEENRIHLSMLRRSVLDEIISEYVPKTAKVIHTQLGIPVLLEALEFFGDESSFLTGDYEIVVDSGGIASQSRAEQLAGNYRTADGELLSGEALLPFCTVVSCVKQWLIGLKDNSESASDHYYEKASKILCIGGLAAAFVILLVNALLFMHYQGVRDDLKGSLTEHQAKLKHFNALQTDIEYREGLLQLSGGEMDGRFAYLIDQVGRTVPEKVQLTGLGVHPIIPRKRESDPIRVSNNSVSISGTCRESGDLDDWISTLSELDMVADIAIHSFEKVDGKSINRFKLNIELQG